MKRETPGSTKQRTRAQSGNAIDTSAPVSADRDASLASSSEQAVAIRSQIEAAAYYRAEQRGFEPGHELEDWLAAEAEVAASSDRPPTTISLSETMSRQTRTVS